MEIIGLEEIKKYLHIEHDLEDDVLEQIVTAGERMAMNWCRAEFDEDCEEPVKQAIMMYAGYQYEHRSEPDEKGYRCMMRAFEDLLTPYADPDKTF